MNKFLFFQGFIYNTRINVEDDIVDTLSQRINQEIDNEIIRTLTEEVSGDEDNLRYFNHWLRVGDNIA